MVDKATTRLMKDLLLRQSMQNQQSPAVAQQLTRRPPAALPAVSPQAAQILTQVIGSGAGKGGGIVRDKRLGQPMMASRSDLMMQRETKAQEEEWPTPPPGWEGSQADWSKLSPYERRQIAGQVAMVVGGDRPNVVSDNTPTSRQPGIIPYAPIPEEPTATPATQASISPQIPADIAAGHNLITTDANRIAQMYGDTRKPQPVGTFPPIIPNATSVSGVGQPGTESYKQDTLSEIDAYIAAGNWSYPPPGSDIDQSDWEQFDTNSRIQIANGMRQQMESMPSVVPEALEDIQVAAGADNEFDKPDRAGPVGWGMNWVKDILDDPVSWAVDQASRPIVARQNNESDIMYYMATHNGELPPGVEGAIYGGIANMVDAINWLPSPQLREQDTSPPTLEDVQQMMTTGKGRLENSNNTDTLIGPLWLKDNQWAFPVVVQIYEDAESAKKLATSQAVEANDPEAMAAAQDMPNGDEAVTDWFHSNQTTLARVGDELLLDPLNLVFVTGVVKRGFLSAADKLYLADHPYLAKILRASGVVVGLPDEVMNKAPERLFEGVGWLGRMSGIFAPSESAVREIAQEGITDAERLVKRIDDPETAMMTRKAQQADAAIAEERRLAEEEAYVANRQFDRDQATEANRLQMEGERQNADEVRAIKAEQQRYQEAAKINNDIRRLRAKLLNLEKTRLQRTTDPARRMQIRADIAAKLRDLEPRWMANVDTFEQKFGTRFERYVDDASFPKGREVIDDTTIETNALQSAESAVRSATPRPTQNRTSYLTGRGQRNAKPFAVADEVPESTAVAADRGMSLTPYTRRLRPSEIPEGATPMTTRTQTAIADDVAPVVDEVPTTSIRDDIPGFVSRLAQKRTPDEIEAFYDDVAPMIQEQFARDDALREEAMKAGGRWDTDERIINETLMEARVDARYQEMFGEPSLHMKTSVIPENKAGAYKGGAGTTRGQIQRAVFGGSVEESTMAFENLARQAARGNESVARHLDELIEARRSYFGSVPDDLNDRMSAAIGANPSRVTPPASAGPDPWDAPAAAKTPEELRTTAVSGSPTDATSSRYQLRQADATPAEMDALQKDRRQWVRDTYGDDVVDAIEKEFKLGLDHRAKTKWYLGDTPNTKAQQAATERLFGSGSAGATDATRNPNVIGIVKDPKADAAVAAEATRAGMQRAVDAIPERWSSPTAKIVANDEAVIRVENLQYADRLQTRFKGAKVTQSQVDNLTTRHTINIGTKEKPVEVTTSYWERYNEVFDDLQSKRDQVDFSKAKTLGEQETALKQFQSDWELDANAARDQVRKEFDDALSGSEFKGKRNVVQQADRALKSTMGIARQNAMYNIFTGPGAAIQDFLGNLRITILGGEAGAARRVPQIMKQLAEMGADPDTWLDLPVLKTYSDMGIQFPSDLFKTVGREQIERSDELWTTRVGNAFHIPNRLNILHALSSETVKAIRQFQDSAWRIGVYMEHIAKNLPGKRVELLRAVEQKTGTREGMWTEIKNLGPHMSVEDIASITRRYGADESIQRTWAKMLDDMSRAANRKQNQLFFTYKKMKIDEPLSRAFMFHYWMTRHSVLYAKLMMQHPQLIRLEHDLWQWTNDSKNDIPQPDWMDGFVGWAYGNGHAVYTDPVSVLSGLTVYSQIGQQGFNRSQLEGIANQTGLFPNPIIRAALSVFGLMSPGDPLMLSAVRRGMVAIANEVRNSDYGKERGWDGFQQDFYEDGLNWIVETANDLVKDLPGAQEIFLTDSITKQSNKAEKILMDNMLEEFGDNPDEWTPEQWRTYTEARDAIFSGAENEYAEAAIDESIRLDTIERGLNVASPTSVITRDVGTIENDAALAGGYGNLREGQKPTPEQESLMNLNEQKSIAPGNPTDLSLGYQEYQDVPQPEGESGWRQIVYDYATIPDDAQATIGGRTYTGAQLKEMTDDERRALADQWRAEMFPAVADPNATGPVVGAVLVQSNVADYKAAREAIRAKNSNLDDFLTYRGWMYDFEEADGGIRRVREEIEAGKPNSKFAQAIEERRQELIGQGYEGESLELKLDQWMTGEEAYAAMMGWGWKRGDSDGESAFDPLAYPWREEKPLPETSAQQQEATDKPKRTSNLRKTIADAAYNVRGRGYDFNRSSFIDNWIG